MFWSQIGYYAYPKEQSLVMMDSAFEGSARRSRFELYDRAKITAVFEGMGLTKWRQDLSREFSQYEILTRFGNDKVQLSWAQMMLQNAKVPQDFVSMHLTERSSFVPNVDDLSLILWLKKLLEYKPPQNLAVKGDYVRLGVAMDALMLISPQLSALYNELDREMREFSSFVAYSYALNVLMDDSARDVGFLAPLLPLSVYRLVHNYAEGISGLNISYETLSRGLDVYNRLMATGYFIPSIEAQRYINASYVTHDGEVMVKRIMVPHFGDPTAAVMWHQGGIYKVLNVDTSASQMLTDYFKILNPLKDRALRNYLRRNDDSLEFGLMQPRLLAEAVASNLWVPSRTQDYFRLDLAPGILLEQSSEELTSDPQLAIATYNYGAPQYIPMRWSIDMFAGMLLEGNADIFKSFPDVVYYEPSPKGTVQSGVIDNTAAEEILFGHSHSASWTCNLKWFEPYIERFSVMNYADFEVLLDLAPIQPALRIAQIVGYRGSDSSLPQLRLLVRSFFSAAMLVLSFVSKNAVRRMASHYEQSWEDMYIQSRTASKLKRNKL